MAITRCIGVLRTVCASKVSVSFSVYLREGERGGCVGRVGEGGESAVFGEELIYYGNN